MFGGVLIINKFLKKIKKNNDGWHCSLNLSIDELNILFNFLYSKILSLESEIQNNKDSSKLKSLINEKNILISICKQLGFKSFNVESLIEVNKEIASINIAVLTDDVKEEDDINENLKEFKGNSAADIL